MKTLPKIFIISLAILLLPGLAAACMCPNPGTVEQEFERYQVVGRFKVVSVEERAEAAKEGDLPTNITRTIKFKVEKVFKGDVKEGKEVVMTQTAAMSCDLYFSKNSTGKEYLFYISSDPTKDKDWRVSSCSRSQEIGVVSDLKWMEKKARKKKG